jgi:hypothetical protein
MDNFIDFIGNTFGIVIYDVRNGTGAIIINDSRYQNNNILDHNDLFNKFNNSKIGCSNSIWEIHGYALFKNNQLFFNSKTDWEYEDLFNDGWNIEYFKYNIYNQNGIHYDKYENDSYQIKKLNKNESIIISNNISKL